MRGFDCGPANALLDEWATRHLGKPYDEGGKFAARGTVHAPLLDALLDEPYFAAPPPKAPGATCSIPHGSTRSSPRSRRSRRRTCRRPTALTAVSVAREIAQHAAGCKAVFVCGGGARNPVLLDALRNALREAGVPATVDTTAALGVPPQQVEALAFAWLAYRFTARQPGNLATVTGAAGNRVLGALYPR